MLEDRSYMKEPVFGPRKSITVTMLIIVGVCYVLQSILLSYSQSGRQLVLHELALTDQALRRGHLWQLLTFQFLHGGFIHVLFNGITLYFFGKNLEGPLPSVKWLQIYFGAGFAGGFLQAVGTLILPYNFPTPVVGASAGVSGLIGAVGFLYATQEVYFWFFRMPARFLFIICLVLSIFFILVPEGGRDLGVAHGAHLGGLLFGYAYARWLLHLEWKLPKLPSFSFRKPKIFIHKRQPNAWPAEKPARPTEVASEEFISQEVDPILDKISAHGIQSLTERERKILEAARARMAKR